MQCETDPAAECDDRNPDQQGHGGGGLGRRRRLPGRAPAPDVADAGEMKDRHVEVIEFPGGDAAHAKVYFAMTLFGDGEDLAVVTLSFKDVNGDGTPDMIVTVGDTHYVFINDSGQFRSLKPGEQIHP